MTTVDLGACEWFIWDLHRSGLIERGLLEQTVAEFLAHHPQAEPPELADYLVQQNLLTPFQSESLLAGKNQGLVLGSYVVTDTLGTGSMGTVYKAYSKVNNNWYAIKVLPRRSMWNIRLARRKVRDFEQVNHPGVVAFVDVGTAGGSHYLVWPFVEGESLNKIVEGRGALPAAEAALLCIQVAEALEASHRHNIIHGQVKPSNIMVTANREVRVLDFGVGALLAETENESVVDTMSAANSMASGLDCASPEGIMDPTQMTPASDQYSLGCVLYYCLTGQMPFPGTNAVEKMMAHQTRQPTPIKELVPDLPDDLAAVVERLMEKDPASRFSSIADVVMDLRPWAEECWVPPAARRPARPTPHPAGPQRGQASSPQTASNPTRPASPARANGQPVNLPDRRSLDIHGSGNGSGQAAARAAQPPATPSAAPRPVPVPARSHARKSPAAETSGGNLDERYGMVIVIGVGLIACIVGWFLAYYL